MHKQVIHLFDYLVPEWNAVGFYVIVMVSDAIKNSSHFTTSATLLELQTVLTSTVNKLQSSFENISNKWPRRCKYRSVF